MRRVNSLIFIFAFFGFTFDGIDANLFVVLLQGGQILTGLGEFSLLHTFSNIPVDEGTFGVHEIELVVKSSPRLSNGGGVGQHADGTLNLGQIATGHNGWGLVVDTDLDNKLTVITTVLFDIP